MKWSSSLVASAALLGPSGLTQDLAWATWGNPNLRIEGRCIAIGDVNQDGHEDAAVIAGGRCSAMFGNWGYVRAMSGRDGAVLYDLPALFVANGPYFRDLVPAGDWNHDGTPDFASMQLAAPYANFVVHDGATGSAIAVHPGAALQIVADCDVNGDGWNDMISMENATTWLGVVKVRSHTGALLYQLTGTPTMTFGYGLCSVGDVNDDGCDDFVLTANDYPSGFGASIVVSGSTGAYLRVCYGEQAGDNMNGFVEAAGDWDGDGYQEFVVGSNGRPGCVVYSARTGAVIRSWYPFVGGFGGFIAGRGIDYDGDSFPDIVAGAYQDVGGGSVHVLSGRDGTTIHRIVRPTPLGSVGYWICGLRPGPGSHTGTILVPDHLAQLVGGYCPNLIETVVRAYRGLPRTAELLGSSCTGNLARAPDLGLQAMGSSSIRVHLSDAPPNVPAVLLLGATTQNPWVPTPVALDAIGLPGCSLRSPVQLLSVVTTGSSGSNVGYTRIDLPLPVPLLGFGTWWLAAQWWVLGSPATFPGGMSQTVRWRG